MVVATALGDFPLARADWLAVETVVLVEEGELVGGRGPAALVIVASLPSGFVPYCTGWNNLIAEGRKMLSNVQTLQYLTRTCKIYISYGHFIADLMGLMGHGLGRGGGSLAV